MDTPMMSVNSNHSLGSSYDNPIRDHSVVGNPIRDYSVVGNLHVSQMEDSVLIPLEPRPSADFIASNIRPLLFTEEFSRANSLIRPPKGLNKQLILNLYKQQALTTIMYDLLFFM